MMLGLLALGSALGYGWSRWQLRATLLCNLDAAAQQRITAAVAEERRQIYADLHDDLGARLLELVYRAEQPELADLARHALMDLRDVVSRTRGEPGSLLQVLGEIELEAGRRLAQAEIELAWQQAEFADAALDASQSLQLFRIVREAVSNVIRHASARQLKIRVVRHAQAVRMELSDDGVGPSAQTRPGAGVASMRTRAEKLAGEITWRGATAGGTRVILSFPLASAAQ